MARWASFSFGAVSEAPERDNRRFMKEFKAIPQLGREGRHYRAPRPSNKYRSFYIARRNLSEEDFLFSRLEKLLTQFYERFDRFDS
jgi:hypothetical protein